MARNLLHPVLFWRWAVSLILWTLFLVLFLIWAVPVVLWYSQTFPSPIGCFSTSPCGSLEKVEYSPIDPLAPPDSPKCSLDNSLIPLDNSYCLLEDSNIPLEKPGLDVKKGFDNLSSLATLLSKLFTVGEAHSEVYGTYGLKESEEEIIF